MLYSQGLHCPLAESLDAIERINGEQKNGEQLECHTSFQEMVLNIKPGDVSKVSRLGPVVQT